MKNCAKCNRNLTGEAGVDFIYSRFTGNRYCIGKREARCNAIYSKLKRSEKKHAATN